MVSDDELRRRAELAVEAAGYPIRNISAYYLLYHLVHNEGVDRLAYDWKQHRDMLYEGYYWYGLAAVTREMANAGKFGFRLDGDTLNERIHTDGKEKDDTERIAREFGRELAARYCPEYRRVMPQFIYGAYTRRLTTGTSRVVDLENHFKAFDDAGGVLADPHGRAEFVATFFENTPTLDEVASDQDSRHTLSGWTTDYEGPLWTQIARHMTRHDTTNPTVWVDSCIGFRHNGGPWFNKVKWAVEDRRPAFARKTTPEKTIEGLLDAGADGAVKPIAAVAVAYDDYYDFNLRRTLEELWGRNWHDRL